METEEGYNILESKGKDEVNWGNMGEAGEGKLQRR